MADLSISKPLTLECGLTLSNRLVKAAMAEQMADKHHLPTSKECIGAYSEWAEGGWGMVITGNVQVDPLYLGAPGDVAVNPSIPKAEILESWKKWAYACDTQNTPTVVQINHPGRQSPMGAGDRGMWAKSIAPSPVPLNMGEGVVPKVLTSIVFGTPREMTVADIEDVIGKFVETAKIAAEAGFAGVEIHAAHGYLLAQFLSSQTNQRTDSYGGSVLARAKIVVEIIQAIRNALPKGCIAIKLNSVDHQSTGDLKDSVEQLKAIVEAGVDFLEISGGTYEDPQMSTGITQEKSATTQRREAFFLDFAKAIRSELPHVPLMVTGGFRSRHGMESAVFERDCDLVGLARPAVLNPSLPKDVILNKSIEYKDAIAAAKRIQAPWYYNITGMKSIGAGYESSWYSKRIKQFGAKKAKTMM